MPRRKVSNEVSEVTIDTTELDRRISDALGGAAKRVQKRIEEEVIKLANEAKRDWPVKTGKSRDAIKVSSRVTRGGIEVSITNDVDYVYYIKADDLGGKNPWRELVLKRIKNIEKELAEELAQELLELLGK